MQTRKKVSIAAACTVAAVLLLITATNSREPSYRDYPLSHWIRIYAQGHHAGWPIDQDTKQALSHIGTNAIPFLTKWIAYSPTPSPIRDHAVDFLSRLSTRRVAGPIAQHLTRLLLNTEAANVDACIPVFSYLGTPALPPLLDLLDEQPSQTNDIAERVSMAFGYYYTDDAIPIYLAYLADTNAHNRPRVIRLLSRCPLATNTDLAVNTLIDYLTNSDSKLVLAARGEFCLPSRLDGQATFVPFLTNRLATSQDPTFRSNIVVLFGDMGLRWTLSTVQAALEDRDQGVRSAATNVLHKWAASLTDPARKARLSRYITNP